MTFSLLNIFCLIVLSNFKSITKADRDIVKHFVLLGKSKDNAYERCTFLTTVCHNSEDFDFIKHIRIQLEKYK